MKLSKREKFLLYFLLCFILVMAGLFLFFLPSMEARNNVDSEYEMAKARLSSLQSTIDQYGDLDTAIEDTNKQIDEIKSKFYKPMPNEDVDRLLKDKLLLHNMTPITLSISEPSTIEMKHFNDSSTSSNDSEAIANPVSLINVSMTINGTLPNLTNLIDDIRTMEATQVGSLSYSADSLDGQVTISFKLYVIE